MTDDSVLPFHLPAVCRKKVTAAFDGGPISSDGGLVLLRGAERRLGLAELLAGCLRDRRDPALVTHGLSEMLRFRMLAIACGYEDADDCDSLRFDPLFKLAVGRVTKRATRMRAVANIGSVFFKDSATSSAIISQTEENLTPTSQARAVPKSLPTPPTSSSETVRNIQTSLATLGYKPGPADVILGHQTRKAIEAFQRDRGLPITGEASAWLDLRHSH